MRSLLGAALLALVAVLAVQISVAAGRPLPNSPSPSPLVVGNKVEPELLKKVLAGDPADRYRFVVELAQQADLTALSAGQPSEGRNAELVEQLQASANQSQAALLSDLYGRQAAGQVQEIQPFWIFNGLSVTADADTLLAVAARPEVRLVREDRWRQWVEPFPPAGGSRRGGDLADGTPEWNIARVRADLAWHLLGIDGAGTTVAIMDTGVDWQHPALQRQYRGYKAEGLVIHPGNWACTTDEDYLYPVDGNGHGTYVAGLAVGDRGDAGQALGVAPGARWIAVKMLDNAGYGYDSWIHAAFQWLVAPAGDPALAPDVVNGSWGIVDGADETFRADLQALRAAGIVPVFAAGNTGPTARSLHSPGSYPEVIAVGATDDQDQIATFSSRGPSPWDEVKPELVAPGAQVRSSLPGGTYAQANGTSAATPHVAGLAALLRQADRALTVEEIESLMTTTAVPLGTRVPNSTTGWGRIDAYQAVAVALHAGYVSGRVTRQPDGQPLPIAQVTVIDELGQRRAVVQADEDGRYRVSLPAGSYRFIAEAFAYATRTEPAVRVRAASATTLDLSLFPLPAGVLWGQVRNRQTGGPVRAYVSVVDTPAGTISDPNTGQYSLVLPPGTYTLEVSENGYRHQDIEGLEAVADASTRADVALEPAPTLLLVDSGRWYYGSQARYFEQALDDRKYVYDLWEVRDLATELPALGDLGPYEITVWSSPLDAPGLIGAGDTISDYLSTGGNLLLTGQDVGFWDGGLNGRISHQYYNQFLRVRAVHDDAGRLDVVGVPGDLLQGLSLTMNGPDSANNQHLPDLIALLDPLDAAEIGRYAGAGTAAVRASGCQSYRATYLAAGLEGLGTRPDRAEVVDRLLTWLASPDPHVGARLVPASQDQVWLTGNVLTYTVELLNTGQTIDRFSLALSPAHWPASVWDAGFAHPITQSLALGACQTQTIGVKVEVPSDIGWNTADAVTLTARSQVDVSHFAQAAFHSKAPAPILLVDDHRWYDMLPQYQAALQANQMPYDVWRIAQTPQPDVSPSLQRLRRYPMVIWFTAYDWYRTLTPADEAQLAAYLDHGGRLLLSSQDYLYTSAFTAFASSYLGVAGYTEGLTATRLLGAVGSPVGERLGPLELAYPYPNYSDALRPTSDAQVAFWGQQAQPAALTAGGPTPLAPPRASRLSQAERVGAEGAGAEQAAGNAKRWKTAFFAFPLEALSAQDMAVVVGRTVDWLSPLGDSWLAADRSAVSSGERLAYTLALHNASPMVLSHVVLSNTVPPETSYVAGSLRGPAWYDPQANRFVWSGPLGAGGTITVGYELELAATLRPGAVVRNVAHLSDETGLTLELAAVSRVQAPDLSGSLKVASARVAPPLQVLTYTFSLQNAGLSLARAQVADPAPLHSAYLLGRAQATTGLLTATAEALSWTGSIPPGQAVTVTIPVLIDPAAAGSYLLNRASLDDGWGEIQSLEAVTWVEARVFLPLVLRGE